MGQRYLRSPFTSIPVLHPCVTYLQTELISPSPPSSTFYTHHSIWFLEQPKFSFSSLTDEDLSSDPQLLVAEVYLDDRSITNLPHPQPSLLWSQKTARKTLLFQGAVFTAINKASASQAPPPPWATSHSRPGLGRPWREGRLSDSVSYGLWEAH